VAGTFLRFLQTIFENTSLWRLKRLVSLSTYRRYINKCIYLSIHLQQGGGARKCSCSSRACQHEASICGRLLL